MESQYIVVPIAFNPHDLGVPCSRPRRYTIALSRSHRQPGLQVPKAKFGTSFFRRCCASGNIFWLSEPRAVVEKYLEELVVKAGLPARQPDGNAAN